MGEELQSKNLGKSVATIEQYLEQHPAGEKILAIGAGPYRVNFHTVACPECGGFNLLRHYCVKTLAMVKSSDRLDYAQQRVQLAAMDGIALAKEFIVSPLWITTGRRGQFIGFGTLYLPFPKWISEGNAIMASRIDRFCPRWPLLRLDWMRAGKSACERCAGIAILHF